MSSKILVETNNPFNLNPEELSPLVDGMRELGRDADVAYHGPHEPEVIVFNKGTDQETSVGGTSLAALIEVTLWIGSAVGQAIMGQIINEATEWMKDYRSKDTTNRPINISIVIIPDSGDAYIKDFLKLGEGEDAEVIQATPEVFESYTRKKPPAR